MAGRAKLRAAGIRICALIVAASAVLAAADTALARHFSEAFVAPLAKLPAGQAQDRDLDRLTDRFERRHARTNPLKADTDGDGLSDWTELKRTRTNPRKADTDGDGFRDGVEVRQGSNPRSAASTPGNAQAPVSPAPTPAPPAPTPAPPQVELKAVWTAPQAAQTEETIALDASASTGPGSLTCKWLFENSSGSVVYQQKTGCVTDFTFESSGAKHVRLLVSVPSGASASNKQSFQVAPASDPDPDPETPPPGDTTAPNTTISSAPSATTTATSAQFSFNASEAGSTFECKLDAGSFAACGSPKSYSGLAVGSHSFAVRATDAASNVDPTPASFSWTITAGPPPPEPPPSGEGCAAGATSATTAAQVRSAVDAGKNVCVVADVGNVNLEGLGKSEVILATQGGSMGYVAVKETTDLTIRSSRFRSILLYQAHRTKLLDNVIGGTSTNRVYDQLILMPVRNDDVRIEGNDLGWTLADDSGNTGYGCRCYGELNRLRFVGNKLHDLAADGFQGVEGEDVLIDRNEIGPVGANPGSNEHSDNIQIVGNGPNLRITNNWIHHQGYFDGAITGNAGSTYIHGGSTDSLIFENNLVEVARGRMEVCGLGTGGRTRSNITIRGNTWIEGGQNYTNFPGFEWDCTGGTGNVIERNVAVDPDGGFALNGSASAASFAANLWGLPSLVTFDAARNCVSSNCNPAGQAPIGFRKPSGVDW